MCYTCLRMGGGEGSSSLHSEWWKLCKPRNAFKQDLEILQWCPFLPFGIVKIPFLESQHRDNHSYL